MSNKQKRPSTARKHTRTTEAERKAELNRGIRLTIEGVTYEARLRHVTPEIARELRAQTGLGFMGLMNAMSYDPDVDLVQAFVWVARRIKGERLSLADVDVDYEAILQDGFDVAESKGDGVEDDADSPEA